MTPPVSQILMNLLNSNFEISLENTKIFLIQNCLQRGVFGGVGFVCLISTDVGYHEVVLFTGLLQALHLALGKKHMHQGI